MAQNGRSVSVGRKSGSLLMSSTTTSGRSCRERPAHRAAAQQREAVPAADAVTSIPSISRARRRTRPAGADQPDPVARAASQARRSRTGGSRRRPPGVLEVLPVDEQDVHGRGSEPARARGRCGRARRSRSRAPGRRRTSGPAAPPRRSRPWAAPRPAAARGCASRRMFRSTTAIRLRRQCSEAAAPPPRRATRHRRPRRRPAPPPGRARVGSGPVRRARPAATSRNRRRAAELPGVEQLERARAALGLSPAAWRARSCAIASAAPSAAAGRLVALVAGAAAGARRSPAPACPRSAGRTRPGCAYRTRDLAEPASPPRRPRTRSAGSRPGSRRRAPRGRRTARSRPRPPRPPAARTRRAPRRRRRRPGRRPPRRSRRARPRAARGDQLVVAAHEDRHPPDGAQAAGDLGHGLSARGGGRACRA